MSANEWHRQLNAVNNIYKKIKVDKHVAPSSDLSNIKTLIVGVSLVTYTIEDIHAIFNAGV